MNILHIISSVNPAGGGPIEGVKQLGGALIHEGHRVEVASLDPPDAPCARQFPIPVYALGPATLRYAFTPRLIPWLRSNRSRYDAVIVNGIWQFHSFAAWQALHDSSTPYVLFTHGMLDPWFKRRYPLKHVKKWMYWPWAEYRVLRDAQAVLFTCEEERVLARQSFWLYRCNEVVVNYGTAPPTGDPQGGGARYRVTDYLDRHDRRRHEMGSAARGRGLRFAVTSGKLRHRCGGGAGCRYTHADFAQGQYLA
jgi:glycosyltransferase involved in cell wall biosynthesis